jgi:hypothetical protein
METIIYLVFYGCQSRSHTLKEEQIFGVFKLRAE